MHQLAHPTFLAGIANVCTYGLNQFTHIASNLFYFVEMYVESKSVFG